MRTGYIYSLTDPSTNKIRYIGQTICKPERRYSQHLYQWKRIHGKINHVNSWIKSLSISNKKPIMTILCECSESEINNKEIEYIKTYREAGCNLCNHNDGGNGNKGYKMNKESIQKRINSCKKSIHWAEKSIRQSAFMKEKHMSGELKFGYAHLSKEKRIEIGRNHSNTMKQIYKQNPEKFHNLLSSRNIPTCSLDSNGKIDMIFVSCSDAGRHYGIDCSHIVRVCKGKSKSGITHGIAFQYYNKNKYDK